MKKVITTVMCLLMAFGGAKMYSVRDMTLSGAQQVYKTPNLTLESVISSSGENAGEPEKETLTETFDRFSTDNPTGNGYISTELSTEPTVTAVVEPETEPTAEAEIGEVRLSYNGIAEGDVIIGELTFYCYGSCCGRGDGLTASGYVIENGVQSYTASCNWLQFGAVIEVDGVEYTIRDRGGKRLNEVGAVDLFEPMGHEAALINGRMKGVEMRVIYLPQ